MATLQVRSMDDQLYRALGVRAAMENRSISQEVIAIVKDYLSHPAGKHQNTTEQLLQLCGTWQDDRPEKVIAAEIRRARVQSKRFGDVF
jgi:plasmid stability protein